MGTGRGFSTDEEDGTDLTPCGVRSKLRMGTDEGVVIGRGQSTYEVDGTDGIPCGTRSELRGGARVWAAEAQ